MKVRFTLTNSEIEEIEVLETFYIKSQEKILNNKKHPHCDKLECKLLNRLENALVILLFFV